MKFNSTQFLKVILLLLSLCTFSQALSASTKPNVWDVLRPQLTLNHEVTQHEVQTQIRWLISHPSYLHQLAQSEPYIYHIVTEIKKRNLPGELALIPMIESAYDPFAYSGAGAAGLWQLMPGTGTDLGLKRDWWFDGRRSIRPSTDAALNYLAYLNKFFHGNWILAIAAYDSGEGTVARAIKNSGQSSRNTRFWTLPVPNETKAYVPRLLALAEIIKYPDRYKVKLPDIPHTPYFAEVNVGSQIDLNHAAKLAGISYKDLIKLNPGYNHWTTAPYKPFKLLIPANKVDHFNQNLASVPTERRVSWTKHQIAKGDNLDSIAKRYATTVRLIRELNQLQSDRLKLGQTILIPSTKNTASTLTKKPVTLALAKKDQPASFQTYKVVHIVQKGENYPALEKKYKVSKSAIQQWNRIRGNDPLKPGTQLVIWRKVVKYGVYYAKNGDNLSTIARKNNTKSSTLATLNPGVGMGKLKPGQRIVVG